MFEGVVALVDALDGEETEEEEEYEEEEEEEEEQDQDSESHQRGDKQQGVWSSSFHAYPLVSSPMVVDIDGVMVATHEAPQHRMAHEEEERHSRINSNGQNTQRRRDRKKKLRTANNNRLHDTENQGDYGSKDRELYGGSFNDKDENNNIIHGDARDYSTASRATLVVQHTFTQEMLREKERMLEALKSENQSLLQEQNQRRREAEFFKSAAIQARDDLLRVESELRVSMERCDRLEHDLEAHQQLSNRLLEQKEKEKLQALNATASAAERRKRRTGNSAGEEEGGEGRGEKSSLENAGMGTDEEVEEGSTTREENFGNAVTLQVKALKEELALTVAASSKRETDLLHQLQAKERNVASLQQEITHLRDANRRVTMEKDELRIAVETVEESLKGELAAHQETHATLRALREERAAQSPSGPVASHGVRSDAGDKVQLQEGTAWRESSPSPIPPQVAQLTRRVHELEASVAAAKHDAAEWKESYDQLARRQASTTVSAGSAYGMASVGAGSGGVLGLGGVDDRAVRALFATPATSASSQCKGAVKRSRRMTQLARKGRPARFAVATLNIIDDLFLDILNAIVNHLPFRILCTYYLLMLHLYIVLSLRVAVPYGFHRHTQGFNSSPNITGPVNSSLLSDSISS